MRRANRVSVSSRILLAALLALGLAPALPAQASAGDCTPDWVATFGSPPGLPGAVYASLVHDDGSGPALYVAGQFGSIAVVPGTGFVARWNGSSWSSVGGGTDGYVNALAIYDDGRGGGPMLYAGGDFEHAGGIEATRIARWDGTSWSPLGTGIDSATGSTVKALAVHDDGNGPGLYAGGVFDFAGGQFVRDIARWDGLGWSSVGGGVNGPIHEIDALVAHDDGQGGGPALYAGGYFASIGGVSAKNIARWDGSAWSEVGGGLGGKIRCMSVIDLGTGGGAKLYVGGEFLHGIVLWDGEHWRQLGAGIAHSIGPGLVTSIGAYDNGSGIAVYAGGHFNSAGAVSANNIARWNGVAWSALGPGVSTDPFYGYVFSLTPFDAGDGLRLYAGGNFEKAGTAYAGNLARWDGTTWNPGWTAPLLGLSGPAYSTVVFDDGLGGGPALIVGGNFEGAGDHAVNNVAKWDGTGWAPLGAGLDGEIWSLAVFDDGRGGGPSLYAGGIFGPFGGPAHNIARWTGTDWVDVGGGVNGYYVYAMQVFDDGSGGGPALFAGGEFSNAGGVPGTKCIAKWDGVAWHPLAGGVSVGYIFQTEYLWVGALTVFDDGSGGGPALYAAGSFNKAGGVPAAGIAKWDGVGWSPLGSGLQALGLKDVLDLEVFDDGLGGGPALYAAGYFQTAGGLPASNIARWNGSSWSPLGTGISEGVHALQVHDDGSGSGPVLVAAGNFSSAGGVPADSLASWDGTAWSAYGPGIDGSVRNLVRYDAGGPTLDLIVGGSIASDSGDKYLARWSGCPVEPSPWHFEGYALAGVAGPPLLAGTGTLVPGTPGTLGLTHAAPSSLAALFISPAGGGAPFKCGALVPVPVALQILLFTNGAGSLPLGWAAWPGGLSGLDLYFQYAILDPVAMCGVAMSNALRADVP